MSLQEYNNRYGDRFQKALSGFWEWVTKTNFFETENQAKAYGILGTGEFESREPEDIRVYKTGGGWGNAIHFHNWKSSNGKSDPIQSIYGFKSWPHKKPRNGDLLITEMESGAKAIFGIGNIRHESNPPDMFFADAVFLGYKEDFISSYPVLKEKINQYE